MSSERKNADVDAFLAKTKWKSEAVRLRKVLLGSGLSEEWKWAKPSYTIEGRNVAVIVTMKASIALLFVKGFALADPHGVLEKQGAHTEVGRWIKFASVGEIAAQEAVLKEYVQEAIAAEKAGVKRVPKAGATLTLPAELAAALKESAELKTAFEGLTPGRRKAYVIFISAAKQSATRAARVEKYRAQILAGKGMLDGVGVRAKKAAKGRART